MTEGHKSRTSQHHSMESAGRACTRAVASLGVWDIIGSGKTDMVLVQVKTGDWLGTSEMETYATSHIRRTVSGSFTAGGSGNGGWIEGAVNRMIDKNDGRRGAISIPPPTVERGERTEVRR